MLTNRQIRTSIEVGRDCAMLVLKYKDKVEFYRVEIEDWNKLSNKQKYLIIKSAKEDFIKNYGRELTKELQQD